MAGAFAIRAFDIHAADRATLETLYRFFVDNSDREFWPDREPIPFNEPAWRLRSPFRKRQDWLIEDAPGEVIAHAQVNFGLTESNPHVANAGIYVRPDRRRRGIGKAMLAEIIGEAKRHDRSLLILGSGSQVPAGEAFLAEIGAEMSLETRINRLRLADLDPARVEAMIAAGRERGRGFTLGFWIDTLPEDELEAIADLFGTMNAAPRGTLRVEDHRVTADQLRQGMRELAVSRVSRWVLYAREGSTGRLAGFTEVFWHPDRPSHLGQGNTGVLPSYRGRGLGRWLKATMLERVLRERPTVRVVDTGNADSNAAMLRINEELGFKLHVINRVWQLPIAPERVA
jgi:mycothiol synthase